MSSKENQYGIIILLLYFYLMPGAIAPRDSLSDNDVRKHVELKCIEQNLPYYKVAYKHYCCGCPTTQYVNGDCGKKNQNTTVCSKCPYNDTVKSYTAEPNTQRQCNISILSPHDCTNIMNSHHVSGNSGKPSRCECNSDSFRYKIDSEKFLCLKHSPCKPNWHVVKKGTPTEPYECGQCPVGECTNGYSFNVTCQAQPCKNASNLSDPTISDNARTTEIAPSAAPAHKSLEVWVYVVIIIAVLIFGVVIGVLSTRYWFSRHRRNSERSSQRHVGSSSSQEDEESGRLLQPSAMERGNEEEDSPNSGNSDADISSGRGTSIGDGDVQSAPPTPTQDQDAQTVGHVTGGPLVNVDANPHKTEDEPLKGCIRSVDPDEYDKKFLLQNFRKSYEPNVGPNCLFEAVVKGKNPNLSDDSVAEQASTMRMRICNANMQEHRQQFHSSIPSSSSSNTVVEDCLDKLRNLSQPCDEIVARAIALLENINIQIVDVHGNGQKYCGSQNQDQSSVMIYIGHVEKNYYLLLKHTSENQDGDRNASSNRLADSDSRVELDNSHQSVTYHADTSDRPQTSSPPNEEPPPPAAQNRSRQSEQPVSNYTRPPELLREKRDWDLFDETDQIKITKNLLMKFPGSDLSVHLDNDELTKAMLTGSPTLLPGVTPLVSKDTSTVNAFVRLPDLIKEPEVLINDAEQIHPKDPAGKRYYLVTKVMEERGMSLSVRLLLSLSRSDTNNVVLYRYFCDCFLKYLEI